MDWFRRLKLWSKRLAYCLPTQALPKQATRYAHDTTFPPSSEPLLRHRTVKRAGSQQTSPKLRTGTHAYTEENSTGRARDVQLCSLPSGHASSRANIKASRPEPSSLPETKTSTGHLILPGGACSGSRFLIKAQHHEEKLPPGGGREYTSGPIEHLIEVVGRKPLRESSRPRRTYWERRRDWTRGGRREAMSGSTLVPRQRRPPAPSIIPALDVLDRYLIVKATTTRLFCLGSAMPRWFRSSPSSEPAAETQSFQTRGNLGGLNDPR